MRSWPSALGVAGWGIAKTGAVIAEGAGISQSVVGALFTAVVTSLPELITTVAAVRRGAVTLAVGGIIGGNTFDVLFLVGGGRGLSRRLDLPRDGVPRPVPAGLGDP